MRHWHPTSPCTLDKPDCGHEFYLGKLQEEGSVLCRNTLLHRSEKQGMPGLTIDEWMAGYVEKVFEKGLEDLNAEEAKAAQARP